MTLIRTVDHPDGTTTVKSTSLSGALYHMHLKAYRALCTQVEKPSSLVYTGLKLTRRVTILDYFYTSSLRMINSISFSVFGKEAVGGDSVKTLKQQQRERQMRRFIERLGQETIYPNFCRATAGYINAIIPKLIAEELSALPNFGEAWVLYQMGLPIRYLNYQIDKRFGLKAALISSALGKKIEAIFSGLRSQTATLCFGEHNLKPFLNFEHLLLNFFIKLTTQESPGNLSERWIQAAIQSLGKSLSAEQSIAEFIQERSDEEALIARIEWHKREGTLPKGVPDPAYVRLNRANLKKEMDEALTRRVSDFMRILLEKCAPKTLKNGFIGVLYWLEGKDFLIELLGCLITEFGIKQLIDPHLFALAILKAAGEETADYELDGFGREKSEEIAHIGQAMMKESLLKNCTWESIKEHFQTSQLRVSPEGYEGMMQKTEAKKRLSQYISDLLYQAVKGNHLQYNTPLKGVREQASRLPMIGTAALTLHGLINGMFFSFSYLFRDEEQTDTSFLEWMAKNFTGKDQCRFFADKLIDLIYHPLWHIAFLQILDALEESLLSEHSQKAEEISLTPITDFVFNHFIRDSGIPFKGNIVPWLHYFTEEGLKEQFRQLMRPSENSLLERTLTESLPAIKELMLCNRLLVIFRDKRIWFEGDQKFWELFLRESLRRLIAHQLLEEKSSDAKISLNTAAALRNQYVEKMLEMDDCEIRAYLSDLPDDSGLLDHWEFVEREQKSRALDEEGLSARIIEDYEKS